MSCSFCVVYQLEILHPIDAENAKSSMVVEGPVYYNIFYESVEKFLVKE